MSIFVNEAADWASVATAIISLAADYIAQGAFRVVSTYIPAYTHIQSHTHTHILPLLWCNLIRTAFQSRISFQSVSWGRLYRGCSSKQISVLKKYYSVWWGCRILFVLVLFSTNHIHTCLSIQFRFDTRSVPHTVKSPWNRGKKQVPTVTY